MRVRQAALAHQPAQEGQGEGRQRRGAQGGAERIAELPVLADLAHPVAGHHQGQGQRQRRQHGPAQGLQGAAVAVAAHVAHVLRQPLEPGRRPRAQHPEQDQQGQAGDEGQRLAADAAPQQLEGGGEARGLDEVLQAGGQLGQPGQVDRGVAADPEQLAGQQQAQFEVGVLAVEQGALGLFERGDAAPGQGFEAVGQFALALEAGADRVGVHARDGRAVVVGAGAGGEQALARGGRQVVELALLFVQVHQAQAQLGQGVADRGQAGGEPRFGFEPAQLRPQPGADLRALAAELQAGAGVAQAGLVAGEFGLGLGEHVAFARQGFVLAQQFLAQRSVLGGQFGQRRTGAGGGGRLLGQRPGQGLELLAAALGDSVAQQGQARFAQADAMAQGAQLQLGHALAGAGGVLLGEAQLQFGLHLVAFGLAAQAAGVAERGGFVGRRLAGRREVLQALLQLDHGGGARARLGEAGGELAHDLVAALAQAVDRATLFLQRRLQGLDAGPGRQVGLPGREGPARVLGQLALETAAAFRHVRQFGLQFRQLVFQRRGFGVGGLGRVQGFAQGLGLGLGEGRGHAAQGVERGAGLGQHGAGQQQAGQGQGEPAGRGRRGSGGADRHRPRLAPTA